MPSPACPTRRPCVVPERRAGDRRAPAGVDLAQLRPADAPAFRVPGRSFHHHVSVRRQCPEHWRGRVAFDRVSVIDSCCESNTSTHAPTPSRVRSVVPGVRRADARSDTLGAPWSPSMSPVERAVEECWTRPSSAAPERVAVSVPGSVTGSGRSFRLPAERPESLAIHREVVSGAVAARGGPEPGAGPPGGRAPAGPVFRTNASVTRSAAHIRRSPRPLSPDGPNTEGRPTRAASAWPLPRRAA